MRQHDALRIGGRARGVEDDRRGGRRRPSAIGAMARCRVDRRARRRRRPRRPRAGRCRARLRRGARPRLARVVEIARRREEQLRARAFEHGAHLRRLVGGVERHGDGADPQHAEIRRDPARVVVRENRDAIAGPDLPARQPTRQALRLIIQRAVGRRLDLTRAAVLARSPAGRATSLPPRRCAPRSWPSAGL